MDAKLDKEQEHIIGVEESIARIREIPVNITKMGRFLFRVKPRKDAGMIYTNVRIAHTAEFNDILEDIDIEMRELGHQLTKQAIQHYATKRCGFLHLFHADVNLKFWQEWFTTRLGKSEGENIVMGLIPGFIYDGIKRTAGVTEKRCTRCAS